MKFHYKEPAESKCPDTALGVQHLLSALLFKVQTPAILHNRMMFSSFHSLRLLEAERMSHWDSLEGLLYDNSVNPVMNRTLQICSDGKLGKIKSKEEEPKSLSYMHCLACFGSLMQKLNC